MSIDLTQKLTGVLITRTCKVRPDKDSIVRKMAHFTFDCSELTINGLLDIAAKAMVISPGATWARTNFDKLPMIFSKTFVVGAPARVEVVSEMGRISAMPRGPEKKAAIAALRAKMDAEDAEDARIADEEAAATDEDDKDDKDEDEDNETK